MSIPLPPVPDDAKIGDGNDRMSETRTAVNNLATRVQPVSLGGTGGTTKWDGKAGLGIRMGTSLPATGDDGDLFFLIV